MSIEGKTRIYKTCVRPIMTYATKTRGDTTASKQLLRTTEMKILRSRPRRQKIAEEMQNCNRGETKQP